MWGTGCGGGRVFLRAESRTGKWWARPGKVSTRRPPSSRRKRSTHRSAGKRRRKAGTRSAGARGPTRATSTPPARGCPRRASFRKSGSPSTARTSRGRPQGGSRRRSPQRRAPPRRRQTPECRMECRPRRPCPPLSPNGCAPSPSPRHPLPPPRSTRRSTPRTPSTTRPSARRRCRPRPGARRAQFAASSRGRSRRRVTQDMAPPRRRTRLFLLLLRRAPPTSLPRPATPLPERRLPPQPPRPSRARHPTRSPRAATASRNRRVRPCGAGARRRSSPAWRWTERRRGSSPSFGRSSAPRAPCRGGRRAISATVSAGGLRCPPRALRCQVLPRGRSLAGWRGRLPPRRSRPSLARAPRLPRPAGWSLPLGGWQTSRGSRRALSRRPGRGSAPRRWAGCPLRRAAASRSLQGGGGRSLRRHPAPLCRPSISSPSGEGRRRQRQEASVHVCPRQRVWWV